MSWAEVHKMSSDMADRQYNNIEIITSSKTWTAPHAGYYKVIAVGAGGSCDTYRQISGRTTYSYVATGGSGGVAIKTIKANTTDQYIVTITNTTTMFDMDVQVTAGGNGLADSASLTPGAGGTATGGDYNYPGLSGKTAHGDNYSSGATRQGFAEGASVGCFIPELCTKEKKYGITSDDIKTISAFASSGYGILGYGAGSGGYNDYDLTITTPKQASCVIIIPLEKM